MKECPRCGRQFNLLERAVGEDREHLSRCEAEEQKKDLSGMAAHCRGCPAGCFEDLDQPQEKQQP